MQEQFIKVLLKEIDVISGEVSELLHQEDVYQTRIKPRLKSEGLDVYAQNNITKSHYGSMLSGIRRQLGSGTEEISLLSLLNKLEDQNNLITEDWYVEQWLHDSSLVASAVDPVLENFVKNIPVGEFRENFGRNGCLSKKTVQEGIALLREATDTAKIFVDKRIAHRDKTEPKNITENDYLEALKTLNDLTSKYILLLKQVGMPSLKPTIQ